MTSIDRLYQQYHGSLVRMLYRRTGDPDRAEDLAQEVFARAVAAPPRNPRPWLFAVALNLVREQARNTKTRERRLQLLKAETPTTAPPADVVFERRYRMDLAKEALATLTERDREVLLLRAEGFDYGEIAEATGLSKSAIGTTLARARRRLVEAYRAAELEGKRDNVAR